MDQLHQIARKMTDQNFVLNGWLVDVAGGRITRDRRSVHLEPLVMRVLAFLVSHPNEVVSKDRLIEAAWGHAHVSDAALTRCIFEIRQVFGDDARDPRVIETIPKVGYRLVATVDVPYQKGRFKTPLFSSLAAAAVIGALLIASSLQLGNESIPQVDQERSASSSPEAYEAYRKGMEHSEGNSLLSNKNAIALFEQALEYDPEFGLAYARLSASLTHQILYWGGDRLSDARAAADKALEFSPSQSPSHYAHGMVLALSGKESEALASLQHAYALDPDDWHSAYNAAILHKRGLEFKKSERLFLEVLELVPTNVAAMSQLGFLNLRTGQVDTARRWLNRAIDQAPAEPYAWSQMATLEMVTGNTARAIESCQKVRNIYPGHRACLHVLGASNLIDQELTRAGEWFDYAIAQAPDNSYAKLGMAQVFIADGKAEQGMEIVDQVINAAYRDVADSEDPWEEYWLIAACYALYGDKSKAFVWLQKAAESGRRFYLWDSTDPVFQALHGDQRFERYIAATREYSRT